MYKFRVLIVILLAVSLVSCNLTSPKSTMTDGEVEISNPTSKPATLSNIIIGVWRASTEGEPEDFFINFTSKGSFVNIDGDIGIYSVPSESSMVVDGEPAEVIIISQNKLKFILGGQTYIFEKIGEEIPNLGEKLVGDWVAGEYFISFLVNRQVISDEGVFFKEFEVVGNFIISDEDRGLGPILSVNKNTFTVLSSYSGEEKTYTRKEGGIQSVDDLIGKWEGTPPSFFEKIEFTSEGTLLDFVKSDVTQYKILSPHILFIGSSKQYENNPENGYFYISSYSPNEMLITPVFYSQAGIWKLNKSK